MEDLNTFYASFMQQAREDAEINEVPVEQVVTETILEYVKDANETNSPELLSIESTKADPKSFGQYKINAFDYSDMSGELDLFVTLFKDTDTIETIADNQVDNSLNKLVRFFNLTIEGNIGKYYRETNPDYSEFADMLCDEFKARNLRQVRFYILTNGRLKEEWNWDDNQITDQNIDCEYHVWDIEAVQRAEQATRQMTEINITLDAPIECIKINDNNDKVNTYVGIIPAIELARIYSRYKDKLIDQNVRNYLGGKIKVNANIAKTLREAPEMFFSYNNGISSTASDVIINNGVPSDDDGARMFITGLRNWHIVNGGQTTCTIFNSYKKKVDISRAFVTMKVSEIKDKESNAEIVQNIAQSANSQTQIKDSDLNANSKYLIAIDKVSKTEWTPQQSARANTLWYFERLRGQLLSDKLNEGAPGSVKVKKFMQARPKEQILTKTDIAKVLMAWDGFPQEASKGNEVCFNNFWKKEYKDDEVTREYFHDIVARRILYLTIHQLFKDAGHKGYANIVDNYVLATVAMKTQQKLDLDYIWTNQRVQPELIEPLKECIEIMVNYIAKIAQDGINPTVVAKRIDFWNTIKIQMANVNFPKTGSVIKASTSELSQEEKETVERLKQIDIDVWTRLSAWGKQTKKMSIMEKKRIDHIIVALGKAPNSITYPAAESCLKILRMSEDAGFER